MNSEQPTVSAQPKLNELASSLPLEQPEPLLAFLAGRGLKTLDDVRRTAGIRRMEGLPVAASPSQVGVLWARLSAKVSLVVKPNTSPKIQKRASNHLACALHSAYVTCPHGSSNPSFPTNWFLN